MKQISIRSKQRAVRGFACLLVAIACCVAVNIASAQSPAPSADVQQIVKLSQAHMTDDVIVSYIKNSGKTYNLSADDVLYLSTQGVSQAVIKALLQTGAPATPVPPPATPAPPPVAAAPVPPPAPAAPAPPPPPAPLADSFGLDAGLNPALWTIQSPVLTGLAAYDGSPLILPSVSFSPAGMQLSGLAGPHQFAGIASQNAYATPFDLTATVSGLTANATPFVLYLVSPDLHQWLSISGHLGGEGEAGVRVTVPLFGVRVGGAGPSPDHGLWVNYTGTTSPVSGLGQKVYEFPRAGVPYTIHLSVGGDGLGSVSILDPAGIVVAQRVALPVGTGPFQVVLAQRNGPTAAAWQSLQLTQPTPPVVAAPAAPTFDYFQAHLAPYGQWIDVPDVGAAWVPFEANDPYWRPYFDSGHWDYTDAGWYWQSDYPWGDIAFHYGRWINNGFTGGRWAWVPAYDWAPSWVVWREGDGGMGWAPMPWGVEFRPGLGLFWHGAAVGVDVDFGLGFDAFVFVGPDHFWGGDYRHYAFDRDRAHALFEHSRVHSGYRMEDGHLHAEGLGRDHVSQITRHEVAEHKAVEMRHDEEQHNLVRRTESNHDLARPGATVTERSVTTVRTTTVEKTPMPQAKMGSPYGAPIGGTTHSGQPNVSPGKPGTGSGQPGSSPYKINQ